MFVCFYFCLCQLQRLVLWVPQELNFVPIFYVASAVAIFMEINFLGRCGQKEHNLTMIVMFTEYKQIIILRYAQFGFEFTFVWCLKN